MEVCHIVILAIIVIIIILLNNRKNEHLTPDEAIQNISSMYNSGNVATNKIQLSNKWLLSGIGDNVDGTNNKDDYLRLTDTTGNNLYGGLGVGKFYTIGNADIKGDLTVGKNLITPTIKSDGDTIKIGKNDRTNEVFIPRKYYTIKADFGGGDLYSVNKSSIPNVTEALKYCNARHDCTRIEENNDTIWFKTCNDGNWMVAGKDWPDDMFGCGGVSGSNGADIKADFATENILDCKNQCKNTQNCDFIQYNVGNKHCWLRTNGNSNNQPVTHFINHRM